MSGQSDVFKVSGFTGCAATKEHWIQLANENRSHWEWRSRISTYDWTPPKGCKVAPFDKKEFILRSIKKGGWMFIGDQVTEAQFFSLSCMLHPHVRSGPNFQRWGGWKHSWPQFIYLNLADPWVRSILPIMPAGFRPELTPIVSYTRVDLLFSKPELADVGAWTSHPTADPAKFWGEDAYTMSALDWLNSFDAKLPAGRYQTLVISSGGRWLPGLFKGLTGGMPQVLRLWRVAMELLTARLVAMLDADPTKTRVVLFRSATPGHEDCELPANRNAEPLTQPRSFEKSWFNWQWMAQMNDILEEVIKAHNHPRLNFLRLDRPASLRVDAHTFEDCARFVVGSGIYEDWNIYMNHFEQWEIDYKR